MSSFKMVAITHFHSQVGTFTETKHRNWKFKIRDRIIKSYIQNTLTNFGMFQIFCLSKRDFKNFNVIILQFINLVDFNKIILKKLYYKTDIQKYTEIHIFKAF